jgi:hypothetical protein
MIKYLNHNAIDKAKWDKTIGESFNGIIYALSWYLDAVTPGWEALVENDYESIMPLTCNRKFGIHYLRPAFITQQLGVFSIKETKGFNIDSFINSIPQKYRWIDIHLNHYNLSNNKLTRNSNFELNLQNDYKALFDNFSINTRRNIKKSTTAGLTVSEVDEIKLLVKIFRENKGSSLNGLNDEFYEALNLVFGEAVRRGMATVFEVLKNGETIAGAVFFTFKGRSIFVFSATSVEGKNDKAMFYLMDYFIRANAGNQRILDFEGSNIDSLAKFYKSFGAVDFTYPSLKINRLPFWLKWIR